VDEQPYVSPVRQQIDEIRTSEAYRNWEHPSHEAALRTIAALYSQEYRSEDEPPPAPEEVEGTLEEAQALKETSLKVDDPEAAKIQEDLQPLKEAWGTDYQRNIEAAQGVTSNLVREYGISAAEVFDTIGDNALVIRNLYAWSRGEAGDNLTADEAKEVIQLLQRTDAYKSGASRTSETVQQIVQALYEIAYRA
jgi:hypothetical protein